MLMYVCVREREGGKRYEVGERRRKEREKR
jgi:hypothetical protein